MYSSTLKKGIYFYIFFAAVLSMAAGLSASSESERIRVHMTPEQWNIKGDVNFVKAHGKETISLKGNFQNPGLASIEGLEFEDGTIEFDMWIDFKNAIFTGLQFRVDETEHQWEYIYFRPGANNQYNAFQYYPHYRKESVWQLYGQHQRAVDIPVGNWFHFKVDVKGQTMTCFFDEQDGPFFFTDRLDSGSRQGGLRWLSSSDVYISNVVVTHREPLNIPAPDSVGEDLDPRYLDAWWVSEPVDLEKNESQVGLDRFKKESAKGMLIQAEEQGMISFTRYLGQPSSHCAVLAKTRIRSEVEQTKKLSLGYSDRIDIYLNKELIFNGNNTYRTPTSKMRSRVHLGNDSVELSLKEGDNLLEVIVYERFGGWGMITQLSDLEGIEVLKTW